MKTEDIQTIEREIEAAIENCVKLGYTFLRLSISRRSKTIARFLGALGKCFSSLKDHAVSFIMSKNITVNDTSVSGMIHCTIDLNTVVSKQSQLTTA